MLYVYKFKDREYLIKVMKETGILSEIKFIRKINGGKGRLPKIRNVITRDLTLLVDMEVAAKLAEE